MPRDWSAEEDSENPSSEEPQASSCPSSDSPPADSEHSDQGGSDPEDVVPLAQRRPVAEAPAGSRPATAGGGSSRGRQAVAGTSSRVDTESPGGVASTVTGQQLANIRARYQISRDVELFLPTPDDRVISSRPGRVAIYEISLKVGLRPPFHNFFLNLLNYYSLTPSQLVPNSLRTISAFVILCHILQIAPRISLFRSFYILRAQKGWWLFQPRPNRVLKFLLPSSVKGWKSRFFFASLDQVEPRWGDPDTRGNKNSAVLPGDKEAIGQMLTVKPPVYQMFLSEENFLQAGLIPHRGKL